MLGESTLWTATPGLKKKNGKKNQSGLTIRKMATLKRRTGKKRGRADGQVGRADRQKPRG